MKNELTYILSLEAKEILLGCNCEDFFKSNLITLPYSLDLLYLDTISEEIKIDKVFNKEKQYTRAFVNVTFTQKFYDMKIEEVREKLYTEGFKLDGEKYVLYKRTSSKARKGKSVIFVKEKYSKLLMDWSLLGINFEQNELIDLASLMAYSSLSMSSLADTVDIPLNGIVIIDEQFSSFKTSASVTRLINGKVVVDNEDYELENNLWDGQCLIDKSIFKKCGRADKGFMQLRNQFFKCAGFNTDIKKFLHDHKVTTVKDMFGREYQAKDVKLIITKSCLKLFKFAYKFESEQAMYKHWLDNISNTFGVCKSEHESHYGHKINRLSYQMINSLPLTDSELKQLAKIEIDYINNLKTNIEAFKEHVLTLNETPTRQMFLDLLRVVNGIEQTDVFKEWRKEEISSHIKKVRKGKLRITDCDYATIVANPLLMLYQLIGRYDEKKEPLQGHEVYTTMFADGEELCCFRSPHIAQANTLYSTNKHCKVIDKYFNFTPNIIVINNIKSKVTSILQGSDQDGDTMLVTSNEILVKHARKSKNLPTPINAISFKVTKRPYNNLSMSDIDNEISHNLIGKICNTGQKLNSQTERNNDLISMLSSFSQLEIDRPKKYFAKEELDIKKILNSIKVETPYFFRYINGSENELTDCSMDRLQIILDKEIMRTNTTTTITLLDLLIPPNDYESHKANKVQIAKIEELCVTLGNKLKSINSARGTVDDRTVNQRISMCKEYAFCEVEKMRFNSYTVTNIVKRMYKDSSTMSNNKRLILQAIFKAKKGNLYSIFPQKSKKKVS